MVGVATRINQVEIRGGDNAHPLQLGEVRIAGSELIREAMSHSCRDEFNLNFMFKLKN